MLDNEQIYEAIPRPVSDWSVSDVATWLKLTCLQSYIPTFESQEIDGEKLIELTPESLTTQLQITSRLVLKNILEWIHNGRQQFDQYVNEQRQIMDKENNITEQQVQLQFSDQEKTNSPRNPLKTFIDKAPQLVKFAESQFKFCNTQSKKRLLLSYLKKSCKIVSTTKIGRYNSNDLVINEESVSRFHAQIVQKDNEFYLKDIGSRFGTLYRITQKTELKEDLVIYLGTLQLLVKSVSVSRNKEKGSATFSVKMDTTNSITLKSFCITNKSSAEIGNANGKKDYSISDESLKNLHARIFVSDGAVWIEQIEGDVYVKLVKDEQYKIVDGCYRLGGLQIKVKIQDYCPKCRLSSKQCGCG